MSFQFPDSVVALLQALIRIRSVNPDGAIDEDASGEKECAEWVGEFLRSCEAVVEFEEVRPGRPNVIGYFDGPESAPYIALAPHLDTVSVNGMTIDPFAGEVSEGKILGRGASDTKGTMAAMLWALHSSREALPKLSRRIAFVGLMGEEAGQPGSIHFAAHHANEFEFAVVGEPTQLETVYASKGCVWVELSTQGRACHGSTPHLGKNAVLEMMPILGEIVSLLERRLEDYPDKTLGNPTVSLGRIQGGSSPNIVPDKCSATLDFRETPALHAAGGGLTLVKTILREKGWESKVEVRVLGDSVPLLTDPETDGVRRLCSIGSPLATAPWFCDAGRLAEGGIPAVAAGPGSIAQAHTKDEYLTIKDLEAGVEFYRRFLLSYA
ncbi:MAG: M20/M25/M40 family metallo-hydrolase [Verrucomicrobiota bacterium]